MRRVSLLATAAALVAMSAPAVALGDMPRLVPIAPRQRSADAERMAKAEAKRQRKADARRFRG